MKRLWLIEFCWLLIILLTNDYQTMSTISFRVPILEPSQLDKLDAWLQRVLWESRIPHVDALSEENAEIDFAVHRVKGRIVFTSGQIKMVQGVREVFEITSLEAPKAGPDTLEDIGKLVLIGRKISSLPWEESLGRYLRL